MRWQIILGAAFVLACGKSKGSSPPGAASAGDGASSASALPSEVPAQAAAPSQADASGAVASSARAAPLDPCPPGISDCNGTQVALGPAADLMQLQMLAALSGEGSDGGARVTAGWPEPSGTIPEMTPVIDALRTRARVCYEQTLEREAARGDGGGPKLAGSLDLGIAVGKAGNVTKVDVVANDRIPVELEACIVGAAKRAEFSRPTSGKPETIRLPLRLTLGP